MHKIKCVDDIESLRKDHVLSKELLEELEKDLHIVHEWSDMDEECDFSDFNAGDFGYGYIVVLKAQDGPKEYEDIGLTNGPNEIVPETADEYLLNGEQWIRQVVVYNDSFSMILWIESFVKEKYDNLKMEM